MPRKRTAQDSRDGGIFTGLDLLVFPAFIASKRLALFESQIGKNGGNLLTVRQVKDGQKPSYIIVDESLGDDSAKVRKLFEESSIGLCSNIVTTKWLSECVKSDRVESKGNYEVCAGGKTCFVEDFSSGKTVRPIGGETKACNKIESNAGGAVDCVGAGCSNTDAQSPQKRVKVDASSREDARVPDNSRNDLIILELQKLADAFTSKGDTWRAHGYNKAISAIRRHGQPINSYEDALKIPGVGTRMAEKVWEILECGSLRKVAEVCGDEKTRILELFTGVWGAGPSTADAWYKQGYRSLEDLKRNSALTKQQQVGLKHYDDFSDRMDREEVERIGAVVKEAALAVEPSVEVMLVGSYRRGKSTCGDVDVLICRPDHIEPGSILPRLLESLKDKQFVTDDLVHIEEQKNQRKYLGVCRLPGENQKHRRLDIFVAPKREFPTALMHYTGSALFNRSIRLDASKKGMSLSEHCLTTNVLRQGPSIVSEGREIPTPTEESIFEALGMKYLEPSDRNY